MPIVLCVHRARALGSTMPTGWCTVMPLGRMSAGRASCATREPSGSSDEMDTDTDSFCFVLFRAGCRERCCGPQLASITRVATAKTYEETRRRIGSGGAGKGWARPLVHRSRRRLRVSLSRRVVVVDNSSTFPAASTVVVGRFCGEIRARRGGSHNYFEKPPPTHNTNKQWPTVRSLDLSRRYYSLY